MIIKVILNGYVIETNIPVVVVVVPKETPAVLQVGKVLLSMLHGRKNYNTCSLINDSNKVDTSCIVKEVVRKQ